LLKDTNIAYICYNLTTSELPLKFNEKENEFKAYLHDTGLLLAIFDFVIKTLLYDTLISYAKEGIYENFVASELIEKKYNLNYYKPIDSLELSL
jgi:predicted AAA+ superfamily ATPase